MMGIRPGIYTTGGTVYQGGQAIGYVSDFEMMPVRHGHVFRLISQERNYQLGKRCIHCLLRIEPGESFPGRCDGGPGELMRPRWLSVIER
jgi:hypothetical protein